MKPEVCAGLKIRVNETQKFPIVVLQIDKCNDLKQCTIHVSHTSPGLMEGCFIPGQGSQQLPAAGPISGLRELHIQLLIKTDWFFCAIYRFLCSLLQSDF